MKLREALIAAAAMCGLCCGFARAQSSTPATPGRATSSQTAPGRDTIMTAGEAKRLLDSVDTVMAFDSNDTGLAPAVNVKRRLISREQVTDYLITSFKEDESAKRLKRSEIVLKKFGLLSQDFQLQPFLLKLLTEQVAGYYDEKTKTVNLLKWVPAAAQEPVLAHELTHALQDKRVDLVKWSNDGFKGVSKDVEEDNQRIRGDELETARQAVTEGQAMLVYQDYAAKHPEQEKDAQSNAGSSDVMSHAPLLLQKSLEFPYLAGMAFEQALRVAGGKQEAFAHALDAPPTSSYEVLNPEAYLAHVPVPVLRMPDVHSLLDSEWQPYDVGVMGELDVDIMASLFSGPDAAATLAPEWDGGIYYAAQRRAASAADKQSSASVGLMYYSQWKSAAAAREFESIYAAELARKDSGLHERGKDEAEGEEVYGTREGDVLLTVNGKTLFISEGYPLATARKLRDAVLAVQSTGPVRLASTRPELALGLSTAIMRGAVLRLALAPERYTATRNPAATTRE